MAKKRHVTTLIAAILSTLGLFYLIITYALMDFSTFEAEINVEGSGLSSDAISSVVVGTMIIFVLGNALSVLFFWLGYGKRSPGLILTGAIITTLFIISNFIVMLPVAVLGYVGFAGQKKLNNEYKLLNEGLESNF